MTREEAIKVIKRMIKTGIAYDDGYAFEPLTQDEEKACGMAINALEQEPKTENVTEFADRCKECGAKYGRLLKQEPKADVLDKIRAEIKEGLYGPEEMSETDSERAEAFNNGLNYCIEIIDKAIKEQTT